MTILCSLLVLLTILNFCIARATPYEVDSDVGESKRDHTGCPVVWKEKCSCLLTYSDYTKEHYTYNGWMFISNCTNSGFTDPAVMKWAPKETRVLIFSGNHFESLPENILSTEHHTLEVLDLSNNGIKQIHEKSFQNLKKTLRRLVLNHNDLKFQEDNKNNSDVFKSIQNLESLGLANTFAVNPDRKFFLRSLKQVFLDSNMKIRTLNLENNAISKIHGDDLFCELPLLLNLYLGNNNLSDINFSEKCMARFQYLGLENNNIGNLTQDTKDKVEKVYCSGAIRSIKMVGNPINLEIGNLLRSCFSNMRGQDQTGCPAAWKGRCSCGYFSPTRREGFHGYIEYPIWYPEWNRRRFFISNCTNSGFTDPSVLEWTPKITRVLIFTGNYFKSLPENILSTSLSKLEVLDLSNNGIKHIHDQSFNNIKKTVKKLILNNNNLNILDENKNLNFSYIENLESLHLTNAFTDLAGGEFYMSRMKQLFPDSPWIKSKTLYLEKNGISKLVEDELFCELPLLLNLHLGNNILSDINISEKCMARLRYLDLENNNITNVSQETWNKIEKLYCEVDIRSIELKGNPLSSGMENRLQTCNRYRDHTGCPVVWQGKCSCRSYISPILYRDWLKKKKFISNCTNSGFTDPAVMKWAPKETGVLIFSGNHFESLPENILSTAHHTLEVLDLSNNGIKQIHVNSFNSIKETVRRLVLDHNPLDIQQGKMNNSEIFGNFKKLDRLFLRNVSTQFAEGKFYLKNFEQVFLNRRFELHLDQNRISQVLDDGMSCESPYVLDLYLGHNNITDISFSVQCLSILGHLGLEYNQMTGKGGIGAVSDTIKSVDLLGNPLDCDCTIARLYTWLRTSRGKTRTQGMRCDKGLPESNVGKFLVDVEQLECPPSATATYFFDSRSYDV
jgi:Leucine-rich repeat (LRR) protein